MKGFTQEDYFQKAIQNWQGVGLLKDIPEDFVNDVVAILENQRIHNESYYYDIDGGDAFKRNSVLIVKRVMINLYGSIKSERVYAGSKLKIEFTKIRGFKKEVEEFMPCYSKLDFECELALNIGKKLTNHIKRMLNDSQFYLYGIGLDENGKNIVIYFNYR